MASVRRSAIVLGALAAAAIASSPVTAGATPRTVGHGYQRNGDAFAFNAHNPDSPGGQMEYDTDTYGELTGHVECLEMRGQHRAAFSGSLDTPEGVYIQFSFIVKDRYPRLPNRRDRINVQLTSFVVDCHTDPFDRGWDEDMRPIQEEGDIAVFPQ